jgi:hypothetical protein
MVYVSYNPFPPRIILAVWRESSDDEIKNEPSLSDSEGDEREEFIHVMCDSC